MTRPPWEVADVIRKAGSKFLERYQQSLTWAQVKVLTAIAHCRTAALGGHRDRCLRCGYQTISYNSCRNRHCPKCQTSAREKWLHQRQQELLPVGYYHLVFSLPHSLVPLVWQNKRVLFTLLFEATAATLLEVAADPKHLGAEIGFLTILHTWGQTLQPHPHVHCVVLGGGLSPDHQRWIAWRAHFFLPVKVLSRVFRGKFVEGLRHAARNGRLTFYGECLPWANPPSFAAFLRTLFREDWVVYAKPPFGGPAHVLQYLARYTHRVAISIQPPHPLRHRLPRDLSMEGLRASQPPTYHEPDGRRVPAPLLAACPPQGLPAHSLLRLAGQSPPQTLTSPLPSSPGADAARSTAGSSSRVRPLAVPLLPRPYASNRTVDGLTDSRHRNQKGHHS